MNFQEAVFLWRDGLFSIGPLENWLAAGIYLTSYRQLSCLRRQASLLEEHLLGFLNPEIPAPRSSLPAFAGTGFAGTSFAGMTGERGIPVFSGTTSEQSDAIEWGQRQPSRSEIIPEFVRQFK
jgi:hypothetical protein